MSNVILVFGIISALFCFIMVLKPNKKKSKVKYDWSPIPDRFEYSDYVANICCDNCGWCRRYNDNRWYNEFCPNCGESGVTHYYIGRWKFRISTYRYLHGIQIKFREYEEVIDFVKKD